MPGQIEAAASGEDLGKALAAVRSVREGRWGRILLEDEGPEGNYSWTRRGPGLAELIYVSGERDAALDRNGG